MTAPTITSARADMLANIYGQILTWRRERLAAQAQPLPAADSEDAATDTQPAADADTQPNQGGPQ